MEVCGCVNLETGFMPSLSVCVCPKTEFCSSAVVVG